MAYDGSCHCGAVEFTVEGEIPTEALACNCSHCRRKGFLLSFVPAVCFTLHRGEDQLTTYRFNKHVIDHQFCKICGCQPFAKGKDADGHPTAMVNLRCVPAADLDGLKINAWDGAAK
jgi:hypothetical protein